MNRVERFGVVPPFTSQGGGDDRKESPYTLLITLGLLAFWGGGMYGLYRYKLARGLISPI